MAQHNYYSTSPYVSPVSVNNNLTLGRRENLPYPNRGPDDVIFEDHSIYKKTFDNHQMQERTQPYYQPHSQTLENFNSSQSINLSRQVSYVSRHSGQDRSNQTLYSPVPVQSQQIPPSIDTHICKQQNRIKHLESAIQSAKNELAEVTHEMLQKTEEYEQLKKIQKNPTEYDVAILKSEITELENSIRRINFAKACSQGDRLPSLSSSLHSTTRHHHTNLHCHYCHQREYSLLLESPTTSLLRDPIDDSLV